MLRTAVIRLLAAGSLVCAVAACSTSLPRGRYVWVDDYPVQVRTAERYLIGPGDALSVRVWDEERISGRVVVRSDGRISLPLLPDIVAAGHAPEDVASRIATQLRDSGLVVKPRVTVAVDQSRPVSVSVMGEVARVGRYEVAAGAGVAEALALAGGPTEFANRDQIYVVRRTPTGAVRIRFTYDAITRAAGKAAQFTLEPGDVVVVE
jgi:polysaccharide biosynthesis/export protein